MQLIKKGLSPPPHHWYIPEFLFFDYYYTTVGYNLNKPPPARPYSLQQAARLLDPAAIRRPSTKAPPTAVALHHSF